MLQIEIYPQIDTREAVPTCQSGKTDSERPAAGNLYRIWISKLFTARRQGKINFLYSGKKDSVRLTGSPRISGISGISYGSTERDAFYHF